MNSIAKIGRSALTRLFCSEVLPSAEPTFPVGPLDLDVPNDVGYMSQYNQALGVKIGKGYLLFSPTFGLVHIEFERDETLFDGVVRCIREKKLSMPHFVIVATWPREGGGNTGHTYTAYRISLLQEKEIRYAAIQYKLHNSRPAFMDGMQVFKA